MDGARDGTCAQMVFDSSVTLGFNGRPYVLLTTAPGLALDLAMKMLESSKEGHLNMA